MGQNFSSQTSIHVHVDNSTCLPGDLLTGTVFLNVSTDELRFKKLEVQVLGSERSLLLLGGGVTGGRAEGTQGCLNATVPLLPAGTLLPGHYQFPWTYRLPNNLPPTFNWNFHESMITIDYNVIAICKQDGLLKAPIQHKAPLTVHQVSATPEDAGPLSAESRRDITSCLCMRQGEITMIIDCSTNYARPNDALNVHVKVENLTKLRVAGVELQLVQNMTICTGTNSLSDVDRTRQFIKKRKRLPVIAPGSTYEADISLRVPPECLPSTRSALMTCSYIVSLVMAVGNAAMSFIEVFAPVKLVALPLPEVGLPVLRPPPGWAPRVFPTADTAGIEDIAPGVPVSFGRPGGVLPNQDLVPMYSNEGPAMGVPTAVPMAVSPGGRVSAPGLYSSGSLSYGYVAQPDGVPLASSASTGPTSPNGPRSSVAAAHQQSALQPVGEAPAAGAPPAAVTAVAGPGSAAVPLVDVHARIGSRGQSLSGAAAGDAAAGPATAPHRVTSNGICVEV